jgi:hypothetical protein
VEILAAEECKVAMISEAVHLDDALQWHISVGKESLNLLDTLLLHPAIWRIVELLLKHIIEVLHAEATDIGKLLNSLNAWSIITHQRHKRLISIKEVVEGA